MKSHPTKYVGVQFRSRLEARWAAFFDVAGWRWEYEPNDEDGWVPDFLLIGSRATVTVEVKPYEWAPRFDRTGADTKWLRKSPELEKMRDSPRERKMILGAYPKSDGVNALFPAIGMFYWRHGAIVSADIVNGTRSRFDLSSAAMPLCYSLDTDDSYAWASISDKERANIVKSFAGAWAEACNRTQWRGVSAVS